MWSKDSETQNIVNLRKAAMKARDELGVGPFTGRLNLELTVYAADSVIESMGDLDNFVTGICDGLQAASSQAKPHETILKECLPDQPILFYDDAKVFNILARKVSIEHTDTYYEIKVEELWLFSHHEQGHLDIC